MTTTSRIDACATRQLALREMLVSLDMFDAIVYDTCGAATFFDSADEQQPTIPGLWWLRLTQPVADDFYLYAYRQDATLFSVRFATCDDPHTPIFDFQVHLSEHEVIDLQLQIASALVRGRLSPVCTAWSVNRWRRFVARTLHYVRWRGNLRVYGPN